MMRMKNGFTLAELLIVIVILGILGGIALPRFYPQQEKGIVAEAVTLLSAIRQGQIAYHLEHGGYFNWSDGDEDTSWEQIGIEAPSTAKFLFETSGGSGGTGLSTATRQGSGNYAGKTITLAIDGTWGGTHPFAPSNH